MFGQLLLRLATGSVGDRAELLGQGHELLGHGMLVFMCYGLYSTAETGVWSLDTQSQGRVGGWFPVMSLAGSPIVVPPQAMEGLGQAHSSVHLVNTHVCLLWGQAAAS